MCKLIESITERFKAVRRQIIRYRSAITGRFVSKEYAEANKSTTVRETDCGDGVKIRTPYPEDLD